MKKLFSTAWGAEGAREPARFFDRRVLAMPPVVRLRRRAMGVEAPVVPLRRPRPRWRPEPPDEVA